MSQKEQCTVKSEWDGGGQEERNNISDCFLLVCCCSNCSPNVLGVFLALLSLTTFFVKMHVLSWGNKNKKTKNKSKQTNKKPKQRNKKFQNGTTTINDCF